MAIQLMRGVRSPLAWLMALVLLVSTGCGFRLQSHYAIPAELSHIQLQSADEFGELHRLLATQLRYNNITLVDDPDAPRLWLSDDRLERSTLSLFPSGQVAEYELIYSVQAQIQFADQSPQQFDIQIRRDYLDDPRTALAKNRELNLILKEMRQQAADRIVRSLAATRLN